jgi:hypothetical protein
LNKKSNIDLVEPKDWKKETKNKKYPKQTKPKTKPKKEKKILPVKI